MQEIDKVMANNDAEIIDIIDTVDVNFPKLLGSDNSTKPSITPASWIKNESSTSKEQEVSSFLSLLSVSSEQKSPTCRTSRKLKKNGGGKYSSLFQNSDGAVKNDREQRDRDSKIFSSFFPKNDDERYSSERKRRKSVKEKNSRYPERAKTDVGNNGRIGRNRKLSHQETKNDNEAFLLRLDKKDRGENKLCSLFDFSRILEFIWDGYDDDDDNVDFYFEDLNEYEYAPVTVAVEAAALCEPSIICPSDSKPTTFSTFVGVVLECNRSAEVYGIKPGRRVASILPWGVKSPFVSISPRHLLSMPVHLDPADISTVIAFYLPAFQALHHGRNGSQRYSTSCLEDKNIFVIGRGVQLTRAIIRLAKYAGSKDIYVASLTDRNTLLQQPDVVTFDEDPNQWLPALQNRMDVVVDCSFPKNFKDVRRCLASKGRLICYPAWGSNILYSVSVTDFPLEWYQLSTIKRSSLFDLKQSAKNNRAQLWDDTVFLLKLLERRQIRPRIDIVAGTSSIYQAQHELECRIPCRGAVIWEPGH